MKQLPRILACLVLLLLYGFTVPSSINREERAELAKDFAFEKSPLYYPKELTPQYVRGVHPQYQRFTTWLSSIGAAVTFADLDGDSRFNDLIHVDPRFDKIFISPAEGTGKRFAPYELQVRTLPFNPATMAPTGTLASDFNEDGKTDILVYYLGRSPIVFYQTPQGFSEQELDPSLAKWNSSTGTIADLDGDGHSDIFIGNYFPERSLLLDTQAKDSDQFMQHSMSRGDNGGQNRIFLWSGVRDGKAVFKEQTNWLTNLKYPADWTLAVAAGDLNGDLLPELYIANDFGPDKLLYNTSTAGKVSFKEVYGERNFNTIRSNVVGKDSFKGMGTDFGDLNGDGLLDIFVSNIADNYALHESHFAFINTGKAKQLENGIAPFRNESEKMGLSRSSWAWEAKMADFNNDGNLEVIQATGFVKGEINRWPELQELATGNDEVLSHPKAWPNLQPGDDLSGDAHVPLFVKHASGKYYDIAANLQLDNAQITRGIAISDVDHDGKLDFATANQWEDSNLYRNRSNNTNSFLGLALKYPLNSQPDAAIQIDANAVPGRFAVGAFAKVTLPNGKKLVSFVDGGNGHTGKSSNEILFGLQHANLPEGVEVDIQWRNSVGAIKTATVKLKPGWHTLMLPY